MLIAVAMAKNLIIIIVLLIVLIVSLARLTHSQAPPKYVCPDLSSLFPPGSDGCAIGCDGDSSCAQYSMGDTNPSLCCRSGCRSSCFASCNHPNCSASFQPSDCGSLGRAYDVVTQCPLCRCATKCDQDLLAEYMATNGRSDRLPQCSNVTGYYQPLQGYPNSGCWCASQDGVHTYGVVPFHEDAHLPCYSAKQSEGCYVCNITCAFGLSSSRNSTTGCLLCECNTNPEIVTLRVKLTLAGLSAADARYLHTFRNIWKPQVLTRIAGQFKFCITQLDLSNINISVVGSASHVSFSVRGNDMMPDPTVRVKSIAHAVANNSLNLTLFQPSNNTALNLPVANAYLMAAPTPTVPPVITDLRTDPVSAGIGTRSDASRNKASIYLPTLVVMALIFFNVR